MLQRYQSGSKKSKNNKTKTDLDSKTERVFKKHVNAWTKVINSIFEHTLDKEQAWRFIKMTPKVSDPKIDSVTLCPDFVEFHDLLCQMRDIENCSDDELGKLCMLVTGLQKQVENQINKESA